MTLEEAIKLEEHTSENYYSLVNTYHTDEGVYLTEETRARNSAEYHEQLAEWLKDYKRLLNIGGIPEVVISCEKNNKVKGT